MLLALFLRGMIIGFTASVPLGPIGVLCLQRTLSRGQKAGFISGLGAMAADTVYAMLAFFSLTVIMNFIETNMMLIKVIGGLCVIIMGVSIFLSNPIVQIRKNRAGKTNLWRDFLTVFGVTIANPALILIFIALFAAFGLRPEAIGLGRGMLIIAGVSCGAATWWFILTFIVSLVRKKFRPRHLLWLNRVSGVMIVVLGAGIVLSIFLKIPFDGVIY